MSTVITVLEVFRIPSRSGPLIVGKIPEINVAPGTVLTSAEYPEMRLEVVGMDHPGPKMQQDGTRAVVVKPDFPSSGLVFSLKYPDNPLPVISVSG